MPSTKRGLGRGLGALIGDNAYTPKPVEEAISTGSVAEIEISLISTNPYQPRTDFDQQAIEELAQSIKELGLIQPITVRKLKDGKYQLISGERRLRAAKIAGLKKLPAYVRDINDEDLLTHSLVENIQREDLNPIEIAISFQRLIDECNYTQEQVSEKTGKARSSIANYLRLLNLPIEIQAALRNGKISMGHAKPLLSINDEELQLKIFYKVIENKLSVRETEKLIKQELGEKPKRTVKRSLPEKYVSAKAELSAQLNRKVDIKLGNKGKGKLILEFNSEEDLQELLNFLKNRKE